MSIQGRKNFSRNNTGKRNKGDFYQTPLSVTRVILERESFPIPILEPASGEGAILQVLNEKGLKCEEGDISRGYDFLKETRTFPSILTNPPFSKAREFILKGQEIARVRMGLLLPLDYLHGIRRFEIFNLPSTFPLVRIYVFARRPLLRDTLREDGKYETGMITYAWFIWERASRKVSQHPRIYFIDNNKDVLRRSSR